MKKVTKYLMMLALIFICVLGLKDDKQQQEFVDVRNAYRNIQEGKHEDALKTLNEYKNNHSMFFWQLQKIFGDRAYSLENVQRAIECCEHYCGR